MHTIPLAVSEQQVSPGTLGFVIVALLGLALFFLIRSMNKHIKRIRFDDGSDDSAAAPSASAGKPAPNATAAAAAKPDDAKPAGD